MSTEDFQIMQNNQGVLEHAQVFDNFYGTAQQTVVDNLNQDKDFILEIDCTRRRVNKKLLPESLSIFILLSSLRLCFYSIELSFVGAGHARDQQSIFLKVTK